MHESHDRRRQEVRRRDLNADRRSAWCSPRGEDPGSSSCADKARRCCCQGLLLVANTMHFVDQRSDRGAVLLAGVDHGFHAFWLAFVRYNSGSQKETTVAGNISDELLHVLLNLLGCARDEQGARHVASDALIAAQMTLRLFHIGRIELPDHV